MAEQEGQREKFFDALSQSFEAMLDAIKSGNERGYRFSRRLITEVEEGQREVVQLARRFARNPKDVRGLYESGVDLARRAAGHSAELARQWVTGAGETRQEFRETATKVIRANRAATQALTAALRQAARDLPRSMRGRKPQRRAVRAPASGGRKRRYATRQARKTNGQAPQA